MAGLRIPTIDGYSAIDVRATLREHGVAIAGLKQVNVPDTVDSLVNGSVDVIINYAVSARHRAQELDVTLNSLHPADWGVQSYSDTLYTTGALARTNPELVERFVRASLQGWR